MRLNFPMPSFNVGNWVMAWAVELRKMVKSIDAKLTILEGKPGKSGDDGSDGGGGNCTDYEDILITASTYTLDQAYLNKTLYVTSTYNGTCTVTIPTASDGAWFDWIYCYNPNGAKFMGFSSTGTGGSSPGTSGAVPGSGHKFRANGQGGWLYIAFQSGTAGTRP